MAWKSTGTSPGEHDRRDAYVAKHPELAAIPSTKAELAAAARVHGQRTLVRLLVTEYFDELSSMGGHEVWGEERCKCLDCKRRRLQVRELSGLIAQVYES